MSEILEIYVQNMFAANRLQTWKNRITTTLFGPVGKILISKLCSWILLFYNSFYIIND